MKSRKHAVPDTAALSYLARRLSYARAFSENKHPRLMREFRFHDPYCRSKFYKGAVDTADFNKLAKLIGICGMLQQTKVYLSWSSA